MSIEQQEPGGFITFDFGSELAKAVPRYEGASQAGLVLNVETYCSGMTRDIALAYIDGIPAADIVDIFGVDIKEVYKELKQAISSIAQAAGRISVTPSLPKTVTEQLSDIAVPSVDDGSVKAWRDLAACLTTDPELFFDTTENGIRRAKQVCAKCFSKIACLEYALATNEEFGVWGETSEDERAALKSKQSKPVGS